MAIIFRLDRIIADRKMSLNKLSEHVGISIHNLSRIKTGKIKAIRLTTLEAICLALNCQPNDLFEIVPDRDAANTNAVILEKPNKS